MQECRHALVTFVCSPAPHLIFSPVYACVLAHLLQTEFWTREVIQQVFRICCHDRSWLVIYLLYKFWHFLSFDLMVWERGWGWEKNTVSVSGVVKMWTNSSWQTFCDFPQGNGMCYIFKAPAATFLYIPSLPELSYHELTFFSRIICGSCSYCLLLAVM